MYAVYRNSFPVEGKGPVIVDCHFSDFEQAHFYVCTQLGKGNRPQDVMSYNTASGCINTSDFVTYPDWQIRRVRAMDIVTPDTDYRSVYQNEKNAVQLDLLTEKVIYDLEELVAQLTSHGMSRERISNIFQHAVDSRSKGA
jgi:hypothetical protein